MYIILLIVWCIVCYFISSFIHEIGHIITGLFQGFKFYLLVIGPIGLEADNNGKLHVYFEKKIALWAGVGGTRPVDLSDIESCLDKFSKILLGGPLTSILVGIIVTVTGVLITNFYIIILGIMPLGMGIACLIPVRAGAFYSDGGRWLRIRNVDTRPIERAIFNIEFSSEPGDYSKASQDDIDILLNSNESTSVYMGCYYMYKKNQHGNIDAVRERIEKALDGIRPKVPKELYSLYKIEL